MGALATAAGALPTGPGRAMRTLAIGLSLTRVVFWHTERATWSPDSPSAWPWSGFSEVDRFPAEEGSFRYGPEEPYRDRRPIGRQEKCRVTEYVFRFLAGGIVVSARSRLLGDMLRSKSFRWTLRGRTFGRLGDARHRRLRTRRELRGPTDLGHDPYEYLVRFLFGGAAMVFTGFVSSRCGAAIEACFWLSRRSAARATID